MRGGENKQPIYSYCANRFTEITQGIQLAKALTQDKKAATQMQI
jgi:hypothetical protein